MDGADMMTPSPPVAAQTSRPTLGFPLGTALLLIVIFSLSGIFSCCYHWDKLRSLRHRAGRETITPPNTLPDDHHHQMSSPPTNPFSKHQNYNREKDQILPVIMPGDKMPKFMAWPCPRQSPLPKSENTITIQIVVEPPISSTALG
ncbi:uncharacterized protein At5g65660-like [Typha angustifolia]|uniref:uncharacterized protein At5g65660-like n=1 Tax=Typha angustifolia TaxID=59011 RepID=UPI003C30E309